MRCWTEGHTTNMPCAAISAGSSPPDTGWNPGFLSRHTDSNVLTAAIITASSSLSTSTAHAAASGRMPRTSGSVEDHQDRLTAILGARVDSTGLTGQASGAATCFPGMALGPGNQLDAGWGIFSQFPEVVPVLGRNGDPELRAEIARNALSAMSACSARMRASASNGSTGKKPTCSAAATRCSAW